jgi:hypothetical protein
MNSALEGAKEYLVGFLPPHPGLESILDDQPTVETVGYFLPHLRRYGRAALLRRLIGAKEHLCPTNI